MRLPEDGVLLQDLLKHAGHHGQPAAQRPGVPEHGQRLPGPQRLPESFGELREGPALRTQQRRQDAGVQSVLQSGKHLCAAEGTSARQILHLSLCSGWPF